MIKKSIWDGPNARAAKDTEGLERAVELRDRFKAPEQLELPFEEFKPKPVPLVHEARPLTRTEWEEILGLPRGQTPTTL